MSKRKIVLVAGVLLTAGVIAAISAPGPRGQRGDRWGDADLMGGGPDAAARGARGPRGWFGPRSLTADEYDTRTRESFARLDKNGDGVLDASEIEAAVLPRMSQGRGHDAKRGAVGPANEFLRRFGDKDGKVTKEAFLTEAKRRFAQMDLNNDGKINDDDLPPMQRGKGLLKSTGPAVPGRMGRMFSDLREADVKQDGVITLEAYMAVQTKRFDALDRNKDGVVNQADFDLMRKEMVDYQIKRFLHAYGADADGKITKEQYNKVAKERFARLDRKGEGKITFGEPSQDDRGGRWFGRNRGPSGSDDRRGDRPADPPKN